VGRRSRVTVRVLMLAGSTGAPFFLWDQRLRRNLLEAEKKIIEGDAEFGLLIAE